MKLVEYRALLGPVVVVALFGVGMLWSPFEPHRPPASPAVPAEVQPTWPDNEWEAFSTKIRWASSERLDTLPIGAAMARLGRSFVGTPYVPKTLEVEGPERLVIGFGGLDCVTFVENVLAMTRFLRGGGASRLDDRGRAEAAYETILREIRYRGGVIDGYPSRLHYFTDWIWDNARRGHVVDVTADLGGMPVSERIDFMTRHTDAYRQLSDPALVEAVRATEAALSMRGRHVIPQDGIARVADRIEEGDIIAATSTVEGLDVAHAGLAVRIDGALHLMHAPLVGEAVQISEVPLADRILGIPSQDGIVVARPQEP